MAELVFHTMGQPAHVEDALLQQGLVQKEGLSISVLDIDWTQKNTNTMVTANFGVTHNGLIDAYVPGIVVVACGSKALEFYQKAKVVPGNIGIEKCRGSFRPIGHGDNAALLTTSYDPNTAFPDFVAGFKADASVAHRVALTGNISPKLPITVEYKSSVQDMLDDLRRNPDDGYMTIALDTETMGLDPYKKGMELVCLSMTYVRSKWRVLGECRILYTYGISKRRWAVLASELNELFNHPLVNIVGANLKYDWAWLAQYGVRCGNRFTFDTLLGGSLVDENRWNGLNQHAKVYTDFGGYDDVFNSQFDKAHMEDVPRDDIGQYAGGDSQACFFSAKKILKKLMDDSEHPNGNISKRSPYNFYEKVLHPAARAFERVEQRGMYIDREAFDEFGKWATGEAGKYQVQLISMLPQSLKSKHEKWKDFTPAVVCDYLFNHLGITPKQTTKKTGKPSTAWTHLQSFQNDPKGGEFILALKEFNALKKMNSTYYVGFLKHLRDDGLFHPTYWLHRAGMGKEGGTVTGRTSVTEPAVQTIPKHTDVAKRLRKCFPAPPGYLVAGLDYSQGELRIIACVANVIAMLEVYAGDGDLHAATACDMLKISLEEFMAFKTSDPVYFEAKRRNAKAGNFGLVYGMSAEGYVDYAWVQYSVLLTLAEATGQRDSFFMNYPELIDYHSDQTSEVKRTGEVLSPFGRVRHLPHIYSDDQYQSGKARRQAINAPIQSCLADMSFWSIALLAEKHPETWVFGNIHDQNLLYVREDRWEDEIAQAKEIMENLPFADIFAWEPQLNFPVDTLVGPNLGELYDTGQYNGGQS